MNLSTLIPETTTTSAPTSTSSIYVSRNLTGDRNGRIFAGAAPRVTDPDLPGFFVGEKIAFWGSSTVAPVLLDPPSFRDGTISPDGWRYTPIAIVDNNLMSIHSVGLGDITASRFSLNDFSTWVGDPLVLPPTGIPRAQRHGTPPEAAVTASPVDGACGAGPGRIALLCFSLLPSTINNNIFHSRHIEIHTV